MSPDVALVLLVIVWAGHDIPQQAMSPDECRRATVALETAKAARDKKYDTHTDVTAYCIDLGTPAGETVQRLLAERPQPPRFPEFTLPKVSQ